MILFVAFGETDIGHLLLHLNDVQTFKGFSHRNEMTQESGNSKV